MKTFMLGGRSIITGPGSLNAVATMDGERFFVVTGKGAMRAAGVLDRLESLLLGEGKTVCLYEGVGANPDVQAVEDGVRAMRDFQPDVIVALGGGSPIDAAKVMAVLYEHPELPTAELAAAELPQRRTKVNLVAVPTTSGTGTEVTRAAVITFPAMNLKVGLKTPAFIPDVAVLDVELTRSMPAHVAAETGMDALTHAVECYANGRLHELVEPLARGAVAGIFANLRESVKNGAEEARDKMHLYQCMAGMAFDNTGLGIAHGIAHALGGRFGWGHGLINAIVLPYALEFNRRDTEVQRKLQRLAREIGADDFTAAVRQLCRDLGIPNHFRGLGVSGDEFRATLEELTDNSLQGSTRFNPVPVTREEMRTLLWKIYQGQEANG